MNREIKFRSYSGEPGTATMKYNVGVHPFMAFRLSNYDIDEQKYDDQTGDLVMTPGLTNLMQYTGLKDKNGKEIYEGDIVRCKEYGEDRNGVIEYWDETSSFNIKWLSKTDFNCYIHVRIKTIEVIGNIYENSELLK